LLRIHANDTCSEEHALLQEVYEEIKTALLHSGINYALGMHACNKSCTCLQNYMIVFAIMAARQKFVAKNEDSVKVVNSTMCHFCDLLQN